eukprot:s418_g4.t1
MLNKVTVIWSQRKIPWELHGKRWYLKVGNEQLGEKKPFRSNQRQVRIPPVKGERIEEESEPDTWRREVNEDGDYLTRAHNTPRFQLFTPERVGDLPVAMERILPGRLTKMIFSEDGSSQENESMWRNKKMATKHMGKGWLGETWSKLSREASASGSGHVGEGEERNSKIEGLVDPQESMDDFFENWIYMEIQKMHHRQMRNLPEKKDSCKRTNQKNQKQRKLNGRWQLPLRKGMYTDFTTPTLNRLVTVLTALCKDSQYRFSLVVPSKGGGYHARDALANWSRELGREKVVIQTDKENSMNKLSERVRDLMPGRVSIRKSPRYNSQSLADGQVVNGLIAGKVRFYKEKTRTEHYLFPWIVRDGAWTVARFHINKTKTTTFKIIKGSDYVRELLPLGETVMGRYPKIKDKAAPRTVRRLPVAAQYQDAITEQARGVPWNTVLDAVKPALEPAVVPEIEGQEMYDFEAGKQEAVGERDEASSQDMVAALSNGEVLDAVKMRERYKMPDENFDYFRGWLDERKENFEAETVANIMDYLDHIGADEAEQEKANDDFGAFYSS